MTINDIINSKDYPQNKENFNKLADLCKSGNVVPYIGAGLSDFANRKAEFSDKFYTWWKYLSIHYMTCFNKELADDADLYKTADQIEEAEGQENFYDNICTTYGGNLTDDEWDIILDKAQNEAISVIPELFNGAVITTNFDQIIEKIHTPCLDVYLPHEVEAISNLKNVVKERKHSIYKVHGSVSDVTKIVFTGKSYATEYNSNSKLVKALSEFYKGFCFLFLGSSLKMSENEMDESIRLWTKLTQSGMFHYAILACNKENKKTRRAELEKQQIHPIFFPEGEFECVKIILDALLKRKKESVLKFPEYHSEYIRRKTVINELEQNLWNKDFSIFALTGTGGVGKTRMACEYERSHKGGYSSGTYFIRATSKENVQAEVFRFALDKKLVNKNEKDQALILRMVKIWMKENDNWLFMLDNVEHYEHIKEFLKLDVDIPSNGKRHFLITARKQDLPFKNKIPISIFEPNEAREFFRTHAKRQEPDKYADDIAKSLGYLPLALEQATVYIVKQEITYKEYIETLNNIGLLETLKQGNHEDGTLAVGATYNMSLRMIESEEAKQLLNICSFFAPDNIHCSWFRDANEQLYSFPLLQEKVKDESEYKEILSELTEYSLVSLEDNIISIHRLTQEVIQKSIIIKEKSVYADSCVRIADKLRYEDFSTAELLNTFKVLSLHIVSIVRHVPPNKQTEQVANLFNFLGWGFNELANYTQSFEYYQKALSIQEKIFGENHTSTAITYNNIGFIYGNQGYYDKALNFCQKALSIQENITEKKHPYTATIYNDIARIYADQGKYDIALKYHNSALNIHEKILGKKSIHTATTYNNIGFIYYCTSEYDTSLKYFFKALKIREKILGKENPFTAITYTNIGMVYYNQGKYGIALKYYLTSLKIREKVFGIEHLELAGNYNNIANVYSEQGEYDIALDYYQKAVSIHERILGKEHPDTASTYNNIGVVYDDKSEYDKALKYYLKALSIQRKNFNKEHPDTANTYNNIGVVYYIQGNYDAALKYYQKALDIQEKVLGKEHPDTANTYNNIGAVYDDKGIFNTALKWFLKSYFIRLSRLGSTQPYTISTKGNMELAHKKSGDSFPFVQWINEQMKQPDILFHELL